jgi:hypothetical protein
MIEERVFGDWSISDEILAKRKHGYEIDIHRLGEKRSDGTSDWALQMIKKTWCAMEEFIPAMQFALSNVPNSIDWAKTSEELQREAYSMIVAQEAARRTGAGDEQDAATTVAIIEKAAHLQRVGWRPTEH